MSEEKKGFFSRLVSGLAKTRANIAAGIDSIFSGYSAIDDDFYEEIEEILIMGDIGINATNAILEDLKQKVKEQHIKEPAECKQLLIDSIREQMDLGENAYEFENRKSVVLVIGVNGVGKTTSVGKLAGQLKDEGKKVILAAADTFRAAAIEQLTEWEYPDAYRETLVVLDGTTGQNAMAQAKQFMEVADITGIILTKLDGTAKGGIAVAIQSELGIPVKYVGVGEKIDDLQKFNSQDFVTALFDVKKED